MRSTSTVGKYWKNCAIAAIPLLLLSLGPQLVLWYDRGTQWQGMYATLNADEFLYSAYLNSLIEGRPPRNDPFTGRQHGPEAPLPETAFSIQFLPPTIVSAVARALGLTASTVFIVLAPVTAVLAAISVFWLLSSIVGNNRLAATGALFVLLTGGLFAAQGIVGTILKLDSVAAGLPFLRRYQPGASFFLLFIVFALIWLALNAGKSVHRKILSVLAGLCLASLLFCYFYLWTTAVAWLVTLAALWLFLRPADRRSAIEVFAVSSGMLGAALIPYARLLSARSQTLDELQTVIFTRQPDFLRTPEFIGALVLLGFAIGIRRKGISLNDKRTLFACSFAITPFIVFNQQVLTGRSMQPFHYEMFVVNYVVLISVIILVAVLWPSIRAATLSWVYIGILLLAAVEIAFVSAVFNQRDVAKDRMIPVALRLKEVSTPQGNSSQGQLVFSPDMEFMQLLPTFAPQATLLGIGSVDFGSATHEERKHFLFAHLYYSGVSPDRLREIMRGISTKLQTSYYVRYVIFGHERVRPVFSLNFQPLTDDEIEKELTVYADFVDSFSREMVLSRPLSFSVNAVDGQFDFSNIDRWYERSSGEQVGDFVLYRLSVRP